MNGASRKRKRVEDRSQSPTNEAPSASETDTDEASSEEDEEVELLVTQREKRITAGNKMAALLESAYQEDDFYKSAYDGGFNEDDIDDVFESPAHSDGDDVDSDFDNPEVEDEPISDTEDAENSRKRKRATREVWRQGNGDNVAKKKWILARMGGAAVAANSVDEKTQTQRLKEAKHTEKLNTESLRKYEEFELEKKKKREKATEKKAVIHPVISERDSVSQDSRIVVYPSIKEFRPAKKNVHPPCAVTGRPAKYRDPISGLPYSTPFAFKVIRDKYHKFLKTVNRNAEVDEFLAQFS